jgi:hypothetical protein
MLGNKVVKFVSIVTVAALLLSACNVTDLVPGFTSTPEEAQVGIETDIPVVDTVPPPAVLPEIPDLTASELYAAPFAEYKLRSYAMPARYTGGYSLPLSPNQIEGIEELPLSAGQLQALFENGFVVVPPTSDPNNMYQEFYQAYESIRYDTTPVFVTTDAVFHVYHLIFDKMLRDLERTTFIDLLKELTTAMLDESLNQYTILKGTAMETAAGRNAAYFAVAAELLDLPVDIPMELSGLVKAEVDLIEGGGGFAPSPIWDTGEQASDDILLEDYSQYIPRGHYTRDEGLKSYFKAMMWYGRMTFRLKDTIETQRALLVVQAMRNALTSSGRPALELWQNIYDPTVFIVGKADDLSIYEYGRLSDEIFGESPDLESFADPGLSQVFFEAAKQLPPPQINSMWVWIWQDRDDATQGFRFMGQRFTLDQFVFGELMWRKVGTLDNPRDLPKSLDFLAVQGSAEAYALLQEMGETDYLNYETQFAKVEKEVAELGLDSWTQNLYWSWLYALQPIFEPKGEQYPAFMQTQAWLRKDMQTALSSWTELKHDTILYAKQVMAEMGGGPEDLPKGYVEPNPEAYARLLALAEMTRDGLDSRGLLDGVTGGNLDNLIEQLGFLLNTAQAELNGTELTDEDYWRIKYFGGWLEAMTVAAADPVDPAMGSGEISDQKSALVADVATGIGRVLEEGVGYPTLIYVVLPDAPYRVAVGAVYTYYEFTVDLDKRMTDEAWQLMIESGNAPDAPDWTSLFIVP